MMFLDVEDLPRPMVTNILCTHLNLIVAQNFHKIQKNRTAGLVEDNPKISGNEKRQQISSAQRKGRCGDR